MRQESAYDESFFAHHEARSLTSAQAVLPMVFDAVRPRRIVDIGCGTGTWLSAAIALGVTEVLGLDGDYVPRAQLQVNAGQFRATDLSKPFHLQEPYDLAISVEVAEHIPEPLAPSFIESLCRCAPVVLFSAAIPYQGGTDHLNEQWPDYWAALFAANGYAAIDCLRDRLWNRDDIAPWYAQNALLFVAEDRLAVDAALKREFERSVRPIRRLVHPEVFLFQAHNAVFGARHSARHLASNLMTAVKRRLPVRTSPRDK